MNSRRSGSATGGLCVPRPSTTSALSFLDPMTVPRPPRPMDRPRLLTMLANSTPRSPAGPITAASERGVQLAHARERRRYVQAPEAGGRPQRRAARAGQRLARAARLAGRRSLAGPVETDSDVARLVQRSGHDQVVPAEAPQGVAEVAARVAVEHGARERRAAGDAVAAARRRPRARERPRREDEQVLRRERVHLPEPLAQRDEGAEAAPAEPQARDLGGQLLFAAGPAGEVDAQAAERPES